MANNSAKKVVDALLESEADRLQKFLKDLGRFRYVRDILDKEFIPLLDRQASGVRAYADREQKPGSFCLEAVVMPWHKGLTVMAGAMCALKLGLKFDSGSWWAGESDSGPEDEKAMLRFFHASATAERFLSGAREFFTDLANEMRDAKEYGTDKAEALNSMIDKITAFADSQNQNSSVTLSCQTQYEGREVVLIETGFHVDEHKPEQVVRAAVSLKHAAMKAKNFISSTSR